MRRLLERGLWKRSQVAAPALLGPVACRLSAGSVSDEERDGEYPERLTSLLMVEFIESSLRMIPGVRKVDGGLRSAGFVYTRNSAFAAMPHNVLVTS